MCWQAMVQAHQTGSAGVDDSEGPRMSMAMRRQLGIAPAKSPSKATSPHGANPKDLLKTLRACAAERGAWKVANHMAAEW